MPPTATRWTLHGLLEHLEFVHGKMPDHAYAWILGAGASRSSGIPLAGDLARRWVAELHRRLDRTSKPLAEWATAENLGIEGFVLGDAASSYSRLYERRFGDDPDEGFAYLEALMTGKDPSPGYSILAQVLERTQHKMVITTNFDNLVADALSIYTPTFPLVIGHESLAAFVRVISRRPVICKIHRDLLLGPKNDTRSLRRLHESWAAALRALFSQFTPLFIGYGGNDDSLMDLLESLDPGDIKGQLIWCYHERFEPSSRVVALVAQHRGVLVPTPDFDLLMVLIGDKMKIEPIDDAIEKRATERARKYREQLIQLDTGAYPDARRILRGAFERAGGSLAWLEKIKREPSTSRRKDYFEEALKSYPDDVELQLEFARFLDLHGLEVDRSIEILQRLHGHDDAPPLAGVYLAQVYLRCDRYGELEALLEKHAGELWTKWVAGILSFKKEDTINAESNYRDAEANHHLVSLLMSQQRHAEAESVLEEQSEEPWTWVWDAMLDWLARKDVQLAYRRLRERIALDSADSQQCCDLMLFALLADRSEDCDAVLDRLRMIPKAAWNMEASATILTVFVSIRKGELNRASLAEVRRLFALESRKRHFVSLQTLVLLAEAIAPKVDKPYRKFIVDLAKAYYEPSHRSNLNVYEIWRTAAE